jgi:hypothetical protein
MEKDPAKYFLPVGYLVEKSAESPLLAPVRGAQTFSTIERVLSGVRLHQKQFYR